MVIDISEIKQIRKQHGLTQTELAQISGVSQSLIAKIESNLIDPSYSNAKKIINTLNEYSHKAKKKAKDLMNNQVISTKPLDTLKVTINKMKKFNISQMPVILDNQCVGYVSESEILEGLLTKKDLLIKDIMKEAPPLISVTTSIDVITNLLKFYPFILIGQKGQIKGVITKSDLISNM